MPVRQRLWQELDMLCRLGLGLAPIAPDVCALLRALVGADAAALFWMDGNGQPAGFHHEDSPTSVRNLFLNEPHLFTGAGETNIPTLAQPNGPRTGRLLAPGAQYFRSNSYNLLVRANGHHHTLDLRVEALGRTRAVVGLFRPPGPGFSDEQAALLERAGASLARAFLPGAAAPGRKAAQATGHVLLDADGQRPALADATALQLLQNAHLPGLGLYGASTADLPADLLHRLRLQPDGQRHIPVPDGVLHAQAHPLHPVADGALQWLVTLRLQRLPQIDVVRRVQQLPLTPLQREIAVTAGLGHARTDCAALTGIGNALLKKQLRTILEAAGASDWEELAAHLQGKNTTHSTHSAYPESACSY